MSETERDRIRYVLNNETLGACDCNDCVSAIARLLTEARAEAWDRGYTSGHSNAMRRMGDEPDAPTTPNPYRATETSNETSREAK